MVATKKGSRRTAIEMMRAGTIDEFRRSPVGRFVIDQSWVHFCARAELWGVVLFGRPDRAGAARLVQSIGIELAPQAERHASYIDARLLTGADAGTYHVLFDFARGSHEIGAKKYSRLAFVCPPGLEGAMVAGFYGPLPPPCPLSVFDRADHALAWLGEDRALEHELRSIVSELNGTSPLVDALRALLRERLVSPDVTAIARSFALSERSLQRRLAEAGTSFQRELQRVRITEAERRLLDTDEPVSTVALDVGFVSPQHFSTRFRRALGESPSAWRARRRRESHRR